MFSRNSCIAGAVWLTCAAAAVADDPAKPEEFAASYVDAVRSQRPQRLAALLHSKSRQCVTPATQMLFDFKWERSIRRGAPEPIKVTASRYAANVSAGTSQSQFPVAPTHQLRIDFGAGSNTLTTILLLAMEDGMWRTVEPCPGDGGTAHIR